MSLLVKASKQGRDLVRVTPESAGWEHVGFSAHRLLPGEMLSIEEAEREACIVILSGRVSITAGEHHWYRVGGRATVFDDAAPHAIYLPPGDACATDWFVIPLRAGSHDSFLLLMPGFFLTARATASNGAIPHRIGQSTARVTSLRGARPARATRHSRLCRSARKSQSAHAARAACRCIPNIPR